VVGIHERKSIAEVLGDIARFDDTGETMDSGLESHKIGQATFSDLKRIFVGNHLQHTDMGQGSEKSWRV